MDKTIAPADTPQQKACACIIKKLYRSSRKGLGTPQQKAHDIVPPDGQSTHAYADEQSAKEAEQQKSAELILL
jgi:hypothetical protein